MIDLEELEESGNHICETYALIFLNLFLFINCFRSVLWKKRRKKVSTFCYFLPTFATLWINSFEEK